MKSLFRRAPTGPPCAHCGDPVTGGLVREWTGPAGTPARTWHGDRPDCRAAALPDTDDTPDYIAGARALLAVTSDCTINGEPAVVVRVAELNDLVARVHRAEAAPLPSPHADVQGRCPACGCTSLLLGEGGYVTCPRIDCPEPDAASTLLEGRAADEAQGCSPACSEGHTYEAPCEQAPSPRTCVWPDCLTDGQQAELAEGVRRSMLGEATVPAPDQRRVCGCRESRTAPDNPVASGDAADNPAVAAPATPGDRCPDGTAAVPGHDWCSKAPHTVETCECGATRTAHDDRLRERVAAAIGDTDPDALDSTAAGDILGAVLAVLDDHLAQLRATNQRLNLRCQQAESKLATYERAVGDWELTERGTYVPLHTLIAIAKAAGREFDAERYIPHYQRVREAEAELAGLRRTVNLQADDLKRLTGQRDQAADDTTKEPTP